MSMPTDLLRCTNVEKHGMHYPFQKKERDMYRFLRREHIYSFFIIEHMMSFCAVIFVSLTITISILIVCFTAKKASMFYNLKNSSSSN